MLWDLSKHLLRTQACARAHTRTRTHTSLVCIPPEGSTTCVIVVPFFAFPSVSKQGEEKIPLMIFGLQMFSLVTMFAIVITLGLVSFKGFSLNLKPPF